MIPGVSSGLCYEGLHLLHLEMRDEITPQQIGVNLPEPSFPELFNISL